MVISSTFKSAAAIFLFALLIRIGFNFQGEHINAFSSADAAEYLRYATAISKLNFFAPNFTPEWKEFVISGPTYPFALWLFDVVVQFLTTFKVEPFNPLNSTTPLIFQSIVSALTCAFIYGSTERLFNRPAAVAAAVISIFYPGFIVNTGRLYSETFATFLECACFMLFAMTVKPENTKRSWLPPFLLGICLVSLQLTRSAMLLFTGATFVFVLVSAFINKQNGTNAKLIPVLSLACGLVLSITPWLVFQNQAFHKTSLVVDRVGQYNLFIGTNTSIQGFLSYPYPDGRGIENKSFGTLIKEAYKTSPNAFLRLMMDKPARLYKFPWNDYRAPILFFDTPWQIAYHQWLLLLAILGLPLGFMLCTKGEGLGRLYLLMAFAINLPYLAFITVPRYNLAAIPVLIIFAGLAITALAKLLSQNSRWAKVALLSGVFLLIYLRDDVTGLGFFASSTIPGVTLLSVQPQEPIQKGIIAAVAALVMFVGMFKLLIEQKSGKTALALTCLSALAVLPLVAIPQRANGRYGENIITIDAPQEIVLKGQIAATGAARSGLIVDGKRSDTCECENWLLIDGDRGELLKDGVTIKINGIEQKSPLIPGLAVIDDWHYLKVRNDGFAYLECAYIFDCMTQAQGKTNLDVRQWFYLPLAPDLIKPGQPFQVEIIKKASGNAANPLSLFAARNQHGKVLKPTQNKYSWEKAFYGVENDRGLTDSRYDEKREARKDSQWQILSTNQETKKAVATPLPDLDINIEFLAMTGPKMDPNIYECKSSGREDITLAVPADIKRLDPQQLEIEVLYDKNYSLKSGLAARQAAKPTLEMTFTQMDKETGAMRKCFMPLPWLKEEPGCRKIALPLHLNLVPGEDLKFHLKHPHSQLSLVLKPLRQPIIY